METIISSLSTGFVLISLLLFVYGSLAIHKSIRNKSSLMLLLGLVLFIVLVIGGGIAEMFVISYFLESKSGVFLNYLLVVMNELLPHFMLFLAGIGLCGVAVHIKRQSNNAN